MDPTCRVFIRKKDNIIQIQVATNDGLDELTPEAALRLAIQLIEAATKESND
jgi:hypothetical protein